MDNKLNKRIMQDTEVESGNKNKIKLLKIWEILSADSDENNPISTKELLLRLSEYGIKCDRRTLYKDIDCLNDCGYEVMSDIRDHSNQYYVSERGFDEPELKILMDAVTAANFITTKKTKELHNKIAALAGSNKAELLKKSQNASNPTKSENESVYYAVNEIEQAIRQGKKISFQYFNLDIKGHKVLRKEGDRYEASPIVTVFSSDRYYLLAFSERHDKLVHFRIDKMSGVKIESEPVFIPKRVDKYMLAEEKKQLFSMYRGETVRAVFEVHNKLADVIFDRFGKKTVLKDIGNEHFTFAADIQKSPVFFGWCLSLAEHLKLIAPATLLTELKDYIQIIQSQYK